MIEIQNMHWTVIMCQEVYSELVLQYWKRSYLNKWVNKQILAYPNTRILYLAQKWNKLTSHRKSWMNLKCRNKPILSNYMCVIFNL